MKAYLAEKYMSGLKADAILARTAHKKKKRKADTTSAAAASTSAPGTRIRDEEDAGWLDQPQDVEDDDIQDAVVEKDRGFKRRKVVAPDGADGGGWATIREGVKEESPPPAADEQPQVVGDVEEEVQPLRGGLLTKAQLRKTLGSNSKSNTEQTDDAAQETIYRDASGRKIDTKAEKAEAMRKKREMEEKEAKKMVWGKGLAQREEKEKTRALMEREREKGFARHADDIDLNEEQKAKELWNDPAAAFLTKKSKGPRKPQYTGPPPPPNRFGIQPGYRWDGVDRSNGFEKKMFQKLNDKKRQGAASYSWGVDDM